MPLIDLSQLMGCSLPMQLDRLTYDERPQVEPDVGRTLTVVQMDGEGFVQALDEASFAAAVAALSTVTRVSGVDLVVTDVGGGTLHAVRAAGCIEGGPHVGFSVDPGGGGRWYRRVRFRLDAKVVGSTVVSGYRLTVRSGPDGLQRVAQAGVISGAGATAAFAAMLASTRAFYQASGYVVDYQADYPFAGGGGADASLLVRYQIRAEQLADPLPGGGPDAGVVAGQATVRTERDEQQRLETSYEFELTLDSDGDYQSIVTTLRGDVPDPIVRESVSYASVRGRQLRCAFQTLRAADQDDLLNYTQTVTVTPGDDAYQEISYPGADPIAVAMPDVYGRVTQSGSAVGLGRFVREAGPLLDYNDQQRPTKRFTDQSNYEKLTEWSYQFLDVDDGPGGGPDVGTLLGAIARPASPEFYGDPGSTASAGSADGGGDT